MPGDALPSPVDAGDPLGKTSPSIATNATIITLDDALRGYQDFDKGAAKKFILDPHGMLGAA